MGTRGYNRMEETFAETDESHVVIYPMVTYNPETAEEQPDIKAQRPRSVQQRVLRCTFLVSLSNAVMATVCMIFAFMARSMSGSNYESCLAVCIMVLVDTCLVWCLRHYGKKFSQEGALESVWTTRMFFICFISMDVLAVCTVIVAGITLSVLLHNEVKNCYRSFYKLESFDTNPCEEETETRYFISILAVTLLAAMMLLLMLILCFSVSMARKFSFKLSSKDDRGKVIVTKLDEAGHKVIFRYSEQVSQQSNGEQTDKQNKDQDTQPLKSNA